MTDTAPQPTAPIVPYLTVDGAARAIDFYKNAFGAQELTRIPDEASDRLMHATLLINGGLLMLSDDFVEPGNGGRDPKALGGTTVTIHLNLQDLDATWKRAVDAGAEVIMPLETQFWGERYGKLRDPFGHEWSLSGA